MLGTNYSDLLIGDNSSNIFHLSTGDDMIDGAGGSNWIDGRRYFFVSFRLNYVYKFYQNESIVYIYSPLDNSLSEIQ